MPEGPTAEDGTPPRTEARSAAEDAPRSGGSGVAPRALILGVLLVPVLCFWNVYSEVVAQSTELAVMSLSVAVVFALLVLLLLNAFLKRFLPRLALSQAELLFVYVMQTVSISISSVGMLQFLVMGISAVHYRGSPENGWAEKFHPYLRPYAFPRPEVLRLFYKGQPTFFTPAHVLGWLAPILFWSGFVVVLLGTFLCLNSILRWHWIEQEWLTFPLIILPLEMTRSGGSRAFFGSQCPTTCRLIPGTVALHQRPFGVLKNAFYPVVSRRG